MDIVSREVRSRMMSRIRGKDTRPEMKVRRLLYAQGFRYRLHVGHLAGSPDIVLPRYRVCIFVHGCFWHRHEGCRYSTVPATRPEFWQQKFHQNVDRDARSREQLLKSGWRVIELWECGLRTPAPDLAWLYEFIRGSELPFIAWPIPEGRNSI